MSDYPTYSFAPTGAPSAEAGPSRPRTPPNPASTTSKPSEKSEASLAERLEYDRPVRSTEFLDWAGGGGKGRQLGPGGQVPRVQVGSGGLTMGEEEDSSEDDSESDSDDEGDDVGPAQRTVATGEGALGDDSDGGSDSDESEDEGTGELAPKMADIDTGQVEGYNITSKPMEDDDTGQRTLADTGIANTEENTIKPDEGDTSMVKSDDADDLGDEEEEDDDDEEEEEEPALKYQRLGPGSTEILVKDTASALAASSRFVALGTHNGMVHILSYEGTKISSYRPHAASINDIKIDEDSEFVATASVEGRVHIHSITSPEQYAFDLKRPMKAIAMEPGFAKKSSRAFVCGGMAGTLVMHEKGWLGHKEQVLHSGEGPIYAIQWRTSLIAWANDLGVKIYDTNTGQRITFIDRAAGSPRPDAFKCTLLWQDDKTLLIAWADYIKVARIRERPGRINNLGVPVSPILSVEITAVFQVDSMISGICPYQKGNSFLVLSYIAPDDFENEATDDPAEQRRKAANRPELRIISKKGEELSSDALSLSNFHLYGCNDYVLVPSGRSQDEMYLVVSPKDLVVARPRDKADHINWLVEQRKFAEALAAAEELVQTHGSGMDVRTIGLKYIQHLIDETSFDEAAALCPKVLKGDASSWEDWIFAFVQRGQLAAIIPYIPTQKPQLSRLVYELVIAHFLANDRERLLKTIQTWPTEIYDSKAVVIAVQGELEANKTSPILMECLAELYIVQRQPGKALPYLLRLRRPDVFDFIRKHNLFSAVQDQIVLLVDFDREVMEVDSGSKASGIAPGSKEESSRHGEAIQLLVDHTHSIPIARVVSQLESRPKYLNMYLDGLFERDHSLAMDYSDLQVELYAEYGHDRLLEFLRASNYYSLEKAYRICKEKDFVPEMVFLLGRMGNNKQALMLIIERLNDVGRAIEFAKEQADEDLWEDLLRYSEDKPAFIRGLLENVSAEINPLRVIRRIHDGLEIPGLKQAVIKILQSSTLQVSLLEDTQRILHSDASSLASQLQLSQTRGSFGTANMLCRVCQDYLFRPEDEKKSSLALQYFCEHSVHATCALPDSSVELPTRPDPLASLQFVTDQGAGGKSSIMAKSLGAKLAYSATVRVRVILQTRGWSWSASADKASELCLPIALVSNGIGCAINNPPSDTVMPVAEDVATLDCGQHGTLQGIYISAADKTLKCKAYYGIPYATFVERFKRALPAKEDDRWDAIDPLEVGPVFWQPTYTFDWPQRATAVTTPAFDGKAREQREDCFTINVWTPLGPPPKDSKGWPVMVWIHGGWLQIGKPYITPEDMLSPDHENGKGGLGLDVIIVSISYRLGVFGFLASKEIKEENSDGLAGNLGFHDQRLALEFVHREIHHFGGDQNNITLSGLSAGAYSTMFQVAHEFNILDQNSVRDEGKAEVEVVGDQVHEGGKRKAAEDSEPRKVQKLSPSNPIDKRTPPVNPGIIKRIILYSNSISCQPKSLEESQAGFDGLCDALGIDEKASGPEKMKALRAVPAEMMRDVVLDVTSVTKHGLKLGRAKSKQGSKTGRLDIHTFRAVTDDVFVHSETMKRIEDGSFAKEFLKRGMGVIVGEVHDENRMYSLTNPPVSYSNLKLELDNYYPSHMMSHLLELYGPALQPYKNAEFPQSRQIGTSKRSRTDPSRGLTAVEQEGLRKAYGRMTADWQVFVPERVLIKTLWEEAEKMGVQAGERVLRYGVYWVTEAMAKMAGWKGEITHSEDGDLWWHHAEAFQTPKDVVIAREWLSPLGAFFKGDLDAAAKLWWGGAEAISTGPGTMRLLLNGEIRNKEDGRWKEVMKKWDGMSEFKRKREV